jgi:NAD-dependent oxidoreductase involved in siderophore biosynthesis
VPDDLDALCVAHEHGADGGHGGDEEHAEHEVHVPQEHPQRLQQAAVLLSAAQAAEWQGVSLLLS